MSYPLGGIRAVELNAGIAIATAGMFLRDAGAEVIKVEPPEGDASRQAPGHFGWNRGKKSVIVEPAAGSAEILHKLLSSADVVLAAGSGQTLGGYVPREDQVVAWSLPYADAPGYRNLPEDDALASALSGVLGGTGAYRPGPAFPVIPTLSYAAGAMLAGAVASALFVRQRTGRGQEVRVPWPTIGAYLAGYQASESDTVPQLPGTGGASPRGLNPGWHIYRASDGWVGVACPNPQFFNRLLACIDRAELLSDARFQLAPFVAPEHRDALMEVLTEAFAKRTKSEWSARFEEYGVPGAYLLTRDEFVADDLVRENNMMALVNDPEVGRVRQVARSFVLGGVDLPNAAPAPLLGGDTEAILASLERPHERAPFESRPLPTHPLEGIRVLDFTGYLAGPTAGRLLVELGAEVIKVEPPEGEGFRGAGLSCVGINLGKKSVAIDSRSPQGRQILERLMQSADVLLHALIPGAPEKLGLDYDTVRQINPKLVYCWISGFGQARQWKGRPSFDLLLQALSGQMLSLGTVEQPVYSSIPMADLYAGMTSLYGIVLGLSVRDRTGQGMFVSTNQVASSMAAQQGEFVKFEGMPQASVTANAIGTGACYRYYRAADGWVILSARDGVTWQRMVEAFPAELATWQQWDSARQQAAEGELAHALQSIFAGMTRHEVKERLTKKGAPCAPVVIVRDDRLSNEYFGDLDVLRSGITHDHFGNITTVADFFRMSVTPSLVPKLAQWVGEQNSEVLRSVNYSEADIARFLAEGVIAAPELRMARV